MVDKGVKQRIRRKLEEAEIGSTILEMKNITKTFPGVVADNHVNFDLRKGEIHGLLGENGAGKTVLMSILYGLYKPDEGEIWVCGEKVNMKSPRDAIELGITMVHQRFALVKNITVLENIVLGTKTLKGVFIDEKTAEEKIRRLSDKFGLEIDPHSLVMDLSMGERQKVEILKALYRDSDILILDEPTTMITPQEEEALFETLQKMVKEGLSIIFISHKIPVVLRVTNRITVLRNGRVVAQVHTYETDEKDLAVKMVGREVLYRLPKVEVLRGKEVLRVEDLWAPGEEKGVFSLHGVSFTVHEGEIFGVAGVAGNGQKELVECIMGLRKPFKGKIYINGKDYTNKFTREIFDAGVAWIPDEKDRGVILDLSVAENMVMKTFYKPPYSKGLVFHEEECLRFADKVVREYDVKTAGVKAPVKTLSGGNIQRLIIAREFAANPKLLIAFNPTKGLDVNATEFTRRKILELRENKSAVLLVSMDLDEVMMLSDRIAVMYQGEIAGVVEAARAERSELGLMMTGAKKLDSSLWAS